MRAIPAPFAATFRLRPCRPNSASRRPAPERGHIDDSATRTSVPLLSSAPCSTDPLPTRGIYRLEDGVRNERDSPAARTIRGSILRRGGTPPRPVLHSAESVDRRGPAFLYSVRSWLFRGSAQSLR